jgi:hypothetical protein
VKRRFCASKLPAQIASRNWATLMPCGASAAAAGTGTPPSGCFSHGTFPASSYAREVTFPAPSSSRNLPILHPRSRDDESQRVILWE